MTEKIKTFIDEMILLDNFEFVEYKELKNGYLFNFTRTEEIGNKLHIQEIFIETTKDLIVIDEEIFDEWTE